MILPRSIAIVISLAVATTSMSLSTPAIAVNEAKASISNNAISTLYIHWFRHGDLRLHDNPALLHAVESANKVTPNHQHRILPIFFFDPRFVGNHKETTFGTHKCGPRRAKFLIESVANLRENLTKLGSGLVVVLGKPEDFFTLCLNLPAEDLTLKVSCQQEVSSEEIQVVRSVEAILQKRQLHSSSVMQVWGSTMYNLEHLPFDGGVQGMPDIFTPFRTKVEKNCSIQKPLPAPSKAQLVSTVSEIEDLIHLDKCSLFYLPTMEDLGYSADHCQQVDDPRGVMHFQGGETAALARVQEYIWDKDMLKVYFDTRNGMLGPDYSTKFSPWLAHGCLSPRYIADQCSKYELERVANKSTYWVVFELLWRDFFKFLVLKHGNSIFFLHGKLGARAAAASMQHRTFSPDSSDRLWNCNPKYFSSWAEGQTGYPLVDANMRELKATGFMSNRGRQNVCSFLAIDMNMDWRYGAYYFEQELLDYDVYSNWGNWVNGAGMLGGRLNRFNIVKQSKDYDADGEYVRHWLPELKNLPVSLIHEPWKMTDEEQGKYGVRLGVNYPNPIIRPSSFPYEPISANGRRPSNNPQRKGWKKEMKSLPQGSYRFS